MLRSLLPLVVAVGLTGVPATASAYDFEWSGKVELEAEALQDADPERRRQAVQALGKYQIALVKPYLMASLRDQSALVRHAAGRILARHKVSEAAPIVIEWLNDADVKVKTTAADILAELGTKRAVAALIRTLGDVDPDVRLRAVLALGQIGGSSVVVPLVGRLEDDKPAVRRHAIEQLQRIGDRRAVIPVVGAFNDSSVDVRVAAVTAVGHLGDEAAIPALMRYVDDGLPKLRNAAVTSLGNLGAVSAVGILIDRLNRTGQRGSYKSNVAYALGKIVAAPPRKGESSANAGTRKRAAEALVKALADRTLHAAAGEALRTAGKAATPALVAHLSGAIDGDPEFVVQLLRDRPDPRATNALVEELGRGRISLELVLDALARSGDPRATVPILGLLSDPDTQVRLRAMQALGPLISTSTRTADVIRRRLDDKSLEIRVLAVGYLGRMKATSAVPRLTALTGPGHELRLRRAATQALGEIGDARAVDALVRLLRGGPPALHGAVADALIYIADPRTVQPLLALIDKRTRADAMPRHQLLRILGGVLRDKSNAEARAALVRSARSGPLRESLAAIAALGAMSDQSAADALADLARSHDLHRRRAALRALGDLGSGGSSKLVADSTRHPDDRVAAAATWALAKLGPGAHVEHLAQAAKTRGWATAVNASAALAQVAGTALEGKARAALAAYLGSLLHHRDRFVRVNAVEGLGRLRASKLRPRLSELAVEDESTLVRRAAIRSLSRLPDNAATRDLLARVGKDDPSELVRAAANAGRFTPAKRSDWREFHVVDPDNGDSAVEQEAYFATGADGLVTAFYTDSRGHAGEEAFPPGDYLVGPKTAAERY